MIYNQIVTWTAFAILAMFFIWDNTAPPPPRGLKIAKCLFFGSFRESHYRSNCHIQCHCEKISLGFFPFSLFEFQYIYRCQEIKANVKFFRVDPYTLWESVCTPKTILTSIRAPDLLWKGGGQISSSKFICIAKPNI